MALVITRGSHPKYLWPGVKRIWGLEYKRHEPIWPKMFESLTSDKAYEEDVEDIGFSLLSVKDEGGGIVYDTAEQGPVSRYTNVTYALGFMVTEEELEDNQYEKASFRRTTRLARSVYETEETIHANTFNRGFNSSFAGGDGQPLFSASHPTPAGNQSNIIAVASDISEMAIENLCIQISGAQDARGMKFNNKPMQLLIPKELVFEANRIVKSTLQNDSGNNAINALKALNVFPKGIEPNVYFIDADAWFVRTDCMEGLTHYTRRPAVFEQDNDFDTSNMKTKVSLRFSVGWSQWRNCYGSPGA